MKISTHFFLGLLSGVCYLSACNNPSQTISYQAPIITATEASYTKTDSTNHYQINLVYPVIDGQILPDVATEINNAIATEFYAHSYQEEFIDAHRDLPKELLQNEWFGQLQNSYALSQCDSILTLHFNLYHYYLGAAHGSSMNFVLHYNLNNGQSFDISNYINTADTAITQIRHLLNSQIADTICWGLESDSITAKVLDNFSISSDSITFHFDDYQLCPFAFSVNEVSLSREALNHLWVGIKPQVCRDILPAVDETEIAMH